MLRNALTDFDKQNLQAAEIILQDPEKHGGEGSLAVRWARMVIARLSGKALA